MISENETRARITPLSPPYDPDVAARLAAMMPPGAPPIGLFRTFAKNLTMTDAMADWGAYELSRRLSLSMRDREILIDRTCARCGAEYEWGVHAAFFARRAGLDAAQLRSTVHGGPEDACWDAQDALLIRFCDALHAECTLDDALWGELRATFSEEAILELLLLAGFYRTVSYLANALRLPPERFAARW